MLALKIVLRNLRSHMRKNVIIFTVTTCVCLFLFLFLAFSDGELYNIKNGISSFFYPSADIFAATPEFLSKKEHNESLKEETLKDAQGLKRQIATVPGVSETLAQGYSMPTNLFAHGQKYLSLSLMPLDPGDRTIRTKFKITEGTDLTLGDGALLHYSMKESMKVSVGDEITLVGEDSFGQITSKKTLISGFFEPYQDNVNLFRLVYLPIDSFMSYAGYAPNEARQILIRVSRGTQAKKVLEGLKAKAAAEGTQVHYYLASDFKEEDPWSMVFRMIRMVLIAATMITLLITAFGIMNVTSTNLAERKKEIGTYYCLGAEPPFLMIIYTLEIFIVNFAGSIAGIAGGLIIRLIINAMNITSTNPGFLVVAGGSRFTLGFSFGSVFWITGGICVLTVLTALTTLVKALRVSPVVAVKETE